MSALRLPYRGKKVQKCVSTFLVRRFQLLDSSKEVCIDWRKRKSVKIWNFKNICEKLFLSDFESNLSSQLSSKLESGVKFVERVKNLCKDKSILPLGRMWRFARRSKDYIRLYLSVAQRQERTTLT